MMWMWLFQIFFMISLKDSIFISFNMGADCLSMFMTSISPLTLFLLSSFLFTTHTKLLNKIYFYFFLFLVSVVSLTFLSLSVFFFLLMLELSVPLMFFLMFLFSKDYDKVSSLIFMILINLMGSIPFMFFLYACSNNMFSATNMLSTHVSSWLIFLCFSLVLSSKLPIFLLHFWLTKAHVSASGSCSMILASIMLKLGSFGLLKFSSMFYFSTLKFTPLIFSLSVIGCTIISLIMLRSFDLKYLVACSSIVHMGMIFPILNWGSAEGVVSSLYMMTGHGLVSYFLFFLVTLMYESSFNRTYSMNKSLESNHKNLSMVVVIFLFFNLGVPPFINFLSEMYFSCFSLKYSLLGSMFLFIMLVLSILFTLNVCIKTIFGKKISSLYSDMSMKFVTNFVFFSLNIIMLPMIL